MDREPTFDADGYPTTETEGVIATWDVTTASDAIACIDYVGRAWKWPEWGWEKQEHWREDPARLNGRPVTRYRVSTGGWSGNESLISALERNLTVQMMGWYSSRRGGHYEYRFPESDNEVYGLPRQASEVGS